MDLLDSNQPSLVISGAGVKRSENSAWKVGPDDLVMHHPML